MRTPFLNIGKEPGKDRAELGIEALTENLVKVSADFAWNHRIDNPEVLQRYLALQQEQQHLELEETRLLCEIKIREDNEREVEALLAEEDALKREREERGSFLSKGEKEAKYQLEELRKEKESLLAPEGDVRIQRLKWELNNAHEEGEYLESALVSMKQEHRELTKKFREERVYQPGSVLSTYRCSSSAEYKNFEGGYRKTSDGRDKRPSCSQFRGYGRQRSEETRDSTIGNGNDEWESSLGNTAEEASASSSGNWNKRAYTHSHRGKDRFAQGNSSKIDNIGGSRASTSGITPSTPRTFTRNKPPPTPLTQSDNQEDREIGSTISTICQDTEYNSYENASEQGQTLTEGEAIASTSLHTGQSDHSWNSSDSQLYHKQRYTQGNQNRGGKLRFRYQKKTVFHMDNTSYQSSYQSQGRRPNRWHKSPHDPRRGERRYQNSRGNSHDIPFTKEDTSGVSKDPLDSNFSWGDWKNLEEDNAGEVSSSDPLSSNFSWDDLKNLEQTAFGEVPATEKQKDPLDCQFSWSDLKNLQQFNV